EQTGPTEPTGREPIQEAVRGSAEPAGREPIQETMRGSAERAGRGPTLDATRVLDTLIRELNLQVPEPTRDPLGFFPQQLRDSLWTEEGAVSDDVYAIQALIKRVERARQLEIAPDANHHELEAMREALRRSDHREAIRSAQRIQLAALDHALLREVAISTSIAAESLLDDSEEELMGYALTIRASELAEGGGEDRLLDLRVARALLYQGITLGTKLRYDSALAAYDEMIRRFGNVDDPALREQLAKALLNKALTLGILNRNEEEIAAYDEVIRRFV